MPQSVRSDRLGDPGTVRGPADDPRRTMAVQTRAVSGQEQRPGAALADGQVDRPGSARRQRNSDHANVTQGDTIGRRSRWDELSLPGTRVRLGLAHIRS